MDRRKTLGVLGGMGPAATALFPEEVVRHTEAQRDQDHLMVGLAVDEAAGAGEGPGGDESLSCYSKCLP